MKAVIYGAISTLIVSVVLGYWLHMQGVDYPIRSGVPRVLSPLLFPAFGALIFFLIGNLNREIIRKNWQENRLEKPIMRPAIALFFGPILALLLQTYVGLEHFDLTTKSRMMIAFTALQLGFFFLMGNYASALRPGSPGGFRNPWTLKSDIVWAKTHRFLGHGLFVFSLIGMVSLFFFDAKQVMLGHIASIICIKIFAFVYSYWQWRTEERQHLI